MKRFVVTGGAGFIGSNLIRYLIGLGHHLLNIDALTYAGNLQSLSDIQGHPNYRFQRLDLRSSDGLLDLLQGYQPDAVLHLAAESHFDRSIEGPAPFIHTNVVGTFHLLHATARYLAQADRSKADAFRFLHVSTDEVFGTLGAAGLFSERSPYDPRSPYSATKAASDHLVRAWHSTYGLPTLITNCSNNYGPFQFPEKLIPTVILKCLRKESIPIYGRGENVRDWLYVLDHCKAIERIVEKGRIGETYLVGGNNEMTNLALAKKICGIMDQLRPIADGSSHESLITFVPDRPGHDHRYAVDASKLKAELDWQPDSNHQQLLKETVQWYLDHEKWWQAILSGQYSLERQGLQLRWEE
ncbi:MAG: dTDP-glucose 4,6-dehydratase [Pirellulaceae bacterium]